MMWSLLTLHVIRAASLGAVPFDTLPHIEAQRDEAKKDIAWLRRHLYPADAVCTACADLHVVHSLPDVRAHNSVVAESLTIGCAGPRRGVYLDGADDRAGLNDAGYEDGHYGVSAAA